MVSTAYQRKPPHLRQAWQLHPHLRSIHGNASLKVGFPRYLTKLAGLPAVGTSPGPNVPRNLAQNGPPAVDNGSWRVLLLNKQDAGEG